MEPLSLSLSLVCEGRLFYCPAAVLRGGSAGQAVSHSVYVLLSNHTMLNITFCPPVWAIFGIPPDSLLLM